MYLCNSSSKGTKLFLQTPVFLIKAIRKWPHSIKNSTGKNWHYKLTYILGSCYLIHLICDPRPILFLWSRREHLLHRFLKYHVVFTKFQNLMIKYTEYENTFLRGLAQLTTATTRNGKVLNWTQDGSRRHSLLQIRLQTNELLDTILWRKESITKNQLPANFTSILTEKENTNITCIDFSVKDASGGKNRHVVEYTKLQTRSDMDDK